MSKWCDRSLVKIPFYYCLRVGQKAFQRELKRLELPRSEWPSITSRDGADAAVHWFERGGDGAKVAIVALRKPKGRTDIEVCGLLVHEAVHIWQEVRRDLGKDAPSSEFEAYSVQWIAQQLMNAYRNAVNPKE